MFFYDKNHYLCQNILILHNMDILYLSEKASIELTQYCENDLILKVLEHFAMKAKIIPQDNGSRPSRWWIITDYLNDNTIDYRKKIAVILSFAAIGGFVQIGERIEHGDVNVLNMLRDIKKISETDFDYFITAFYNFSQGNGVKFSI